MKREPDRPLFLVADDVPTVAMLVCGLVEEAGAHVLGPAADGAEALRLYREARPDGAVLDVQMPHMTGIEVVRAIRGDDDGGRRGPLVIITSSAEPEIRHEALEAGADHFLVKGVDLDRLNDIVADFVARRRNG